MADAPDDEPPPEKNPYRVDDAQLRRLRIQREMWQEKSGLPQQTHPMPPGYTLH